MRHLLDVNVLLAAIWNTHVHHSRVFSWLTDKQVALCPISELGFLRISTNKRALGVEMGRARQALQKFSVDLKAARIPDDLPALNSRARTSEQVTDHYLADLAAKHGMKLATLDASIRHVSAEFIR